MIEGKRISRHQSTLYEKGVSLLPPSHLRLCLSVCLCIVNHKAVTNGEITIIIINVTRRRRRRRSSMKRKFIHIKSVVLCSIDTPCQVTWHAGRIAVSLGRHVIFECSSSLWRWRSIIIHIHNNVLWDWQYFMWFSVFKLYTHLS